MIRQQDNFLLIETNDLLLAFEIKPYEDARTPFNKGKKFITQFYYGLKENCPKLEPSALLLPAHGSNDDYNPDFFISSTYGNGNNCEPLLLIENSDNTLVNRFFYKGFNIINGPKEIKGPHTRNVKETLEVIEEDEVLGLELHHYYSLVEGSNVIASKKEVVNKGKKPCSIKRLFSLELPINSNDLEFESFDGAWLFERSRHVTEVVNGVYSVDSKVGHSSHKHNPYVQLIDKKNGGVCYAFNLIYSGNHKELLEVDSRAHATFMNGINDFAFSYKLLPGESFITPESVFVTAKNKDELTKEMHRFALNNVINPNFALKDRPIVFNTWEGVGMNVNEQALLDMAKIAKGVGVELFVLDDGWFVNRKNDSGGLGDWFVDKEKFPDGMKSCVDKIKAIGLKFGIWVEPEMICINSDLYKNHPEYACLIPGREPIERRHQLMIDMANPAVVDYLYESLSQVFEEIKPDYVKWDYNRFHNDMYSSTGIASGEFLYKTMYGSYDLLERLMKRFPNILFEGCASGGGRFDLGALYYTPQIWGSDDTNSYVRTFITTGTISGYPQSTIGAHVSRDYCPIPDKNAFASLEDRFNLNCIGAFGYEFDFRTFNKDELDIMAKQIVFYKKHRSLLQRGTFYFNKNVFDDNDRCSWNVVSDDKKEAILFVEDTRASLEPIAWRAKGLDESKTYVVERRSQYNTKEFAAIEISGKTLMENGLVLPPLDERSDKEKYSKGVFNSLFYIKEKE
ncbi:MAG: alpha-galactosidase [Bacilli bacterium]|nr:alpha-galactosidase [Bacilli bacterium]